MLENCMSAQERWGGVSEIIDKWLAERQELLVLYCNISDQYNDISEDSLESQVRSLCQIAVDYVSAGHFEVYDQLIQEGREFEDKDALKTAGKLFKLIDSSTEIVLDFNDKYLATDDLEAIETDLSRLGEALSTRFEAEDRMIDVLHTAHKDQVA